MSNGSLSSQSSSHGTSTRRSLLIRVTAGEEEAWADLIALYGPLVEFWCVRQGVHRNDLPDLFQEIFHAVNLNIDKFRKQKSRDSFRGWLRTITRNKVIDQFRRNATQPDLALGSSARQQVANAQSTKGSAIEGPAEISALYQRALELIRPRFNPETWQAFWRTAVDDLDSTFVAEELGKTAGAVRVAKARVLRALREELIEDVEGLTQ